MRVVPNLYPAFERQEVVVHSAEHKRAFADLDDEEVELLAQAWRERRRANPDGYLHALVNEGRDAGASLPHSHSQLVWFHDVPPAVRDDPEPGDTDVVLERDGVTAGCPPDSRVPYELLIAPARAERDAFASALLPSALLALRDVLRALREVEGHVPYNVWLHDTPTWHIEVLPRLGVLAGVELGTGVYINTLPPDEAARRLREAVST